MEQKNQQAVYHLFNGIILFLIDQEIINLNPVWKTCYPDYYSSRILF
jgi:succinate dehydrogenase/fumarate reductase cytochrome b subunit